MCPTYDFKCPNCSGISIYAVPYADRDSPNTLKCETCLTSGLTRQFSAPRVMRESYRDGVKRPGWAEMRAHSKMSLQLLKEKGKLDRSPEVAREIKAEMEKARQAYQNKVQWSGGEDGVAAKQDSGGSEEGD